MRGKLLLPGCLLLLCAVVAEPQPPQTEKVRYQRPAGQGFAAECTFTIERTPNGWSIVSITERGDTPMTVTARYDREDRLIAAEASMTKGDQKTAVRVAVSDGKAMIQRSGQPAQEFAVPKGVLVTSAPDWTDTFLLCRRYDRSKGGKQAFAGLWIHPTQPAQLLPFSIERTGKETIQHGGKPIEVERYTIQIRGPSRYVAWGDAQGNMVRLIALPDKPGSLSGLFLEGYEKSTAELRPGQP